MTNETWLRLNYQIPKRGKMTMAEYHRALGESLFSITAEAEHVKAEAEATKAKFDDLAADLSQVLELWGDVLAAMEIVLDELETIRKDNREAVS